MRDLGPDAERLSTARAAITQPIDWYRYDILGSLLHLDAMLVGDLRDLHKLTGGLPVADIGAADGDLAFTLENHFGWDIDLVDSAATNINGLAGARALREQLGSRVQISDIDLDAQFVLPRERYGLVFFLGLLYHLQNPFYALRTLAVHSQHCLLSTRVARFAGETDTPVADLPVGYLVSPSETNNDPTNFWIFSPAGLERLVGRAGWDVLAKLSVGSSERSNPSSPDRDERMFMLLRSDTIRD